MPALLNLGCGTDIVRREGFDCVNLDVLPLEGVDVVHDMMRTPWPFKDETFDAVLASHVLEHVPAGEDGRGFLRVMEELHRVMRPGGFLVVRAPHWLDHESAWADPTHTRVLFPRTWAYFSGDASVAPQFYSRARFRLVSAKTSRVRPRFPGVPLLWRLPSPSEATFTLLRGKAL